MSGVCFILNKDPGSVLSLRDYIAKCNLSATSTHATARDLLPASSAEDATQLHPQRPPEVQQEGVTEPEALHGAGQPEPLPVEGTSEAGDPEFNAKLAVETPQLLVNALRMIRVAMQKLITVGKIEVWD